MSTPYIDNKDVWSGIFMKRERGTWKVWAVTILLFAVVVLATIQVKDQAVLNITGKNTKELVMVDPGHGGMQGRPKKYFDYL